MNIGSLFQARSEAFPQRVFLIFPKEELQFDYAGFYALASTAAERLERAGLERGDSLCLVFPNGPEFLLYYFAAHLLGVVLVPINPVLSVNEMAFIIANSGARLALFDASLSNLIAAIERCESSCRLEALQRPSVFTLANLLEQPAALRSARSDVGLEDLALVLYTSGTTGNPKGVLLTHGNFLADSQALVEWFAFEDGTRTLCVLPMFHNNGQVITLLSPLYVGGSSVILEGRSALLSFWTMIERYRVDWTSVMPAFLSAFLEYRLPRTDCTLKGIVCGGQVLLEEVRSQFERCYEVAVFEGYGLTETTSFSCLNRFPAERRCLGSIGEALPCNRMKVVDGEGNELPPGEIGEILIQGENVARGYHNLPLTTQQRFCAGWLHTGDYGYRNAQGHYFFSTRLDDLIIRGGENIYPAELENLLHACDEVVECAAVGVPDPLLGQEICLYVKLRQGSDVDSDWIRNYCRLRIAAFKQPKHVLILGPDIGMQELPKGPTRKILRRQLKEHYLLNNNMSAT
ncbi:class I adenylate-forming enzyme family protein [Pseudomonas sp. Irchel s3a18]|uniref:class I adenylate-forming enzyme family protein n=1 Tax=Pseudomonas sp. Irchel s3a18 TaxID=2009053 RepID=UPI001C43BC6B|nr:class I adenylate-forming enzyme family protein [Pseudomonas sp. Irchel s3a18]